MKRSIVVCMAVIGLFVVGCSTPARHISGLRLGMTPDEVIDIMGKPFSIRAAKLFENEEWQEEWEYVPPVFSVAGFADRYDKEFRLLFENGRLVRWGQPGDFTGETESKETTSTLEYSPARED